MPGAIGIFGKKVTLSGTYQEHVRNMSGTLHRLMSHVGRGTSMSVTIFVKKVTLSGTYWEHVRNMSGTYQEHYTDCVERGTSMSVTIF